MEVATLKGLMEGAKADFSKLEIVDVGAMDYFTAVKDHADFNSGSLRLGWRLSRT